MANVSDYLAKILSAVYGEEVRGSIHDAIEAMNTESSNAMSYAKTAQDSASASAQNASKSETNASTYAGNAKNSATAASTSASNAKNSATTASTSASNAKTSETNAKTSEGNAQTHESNASDYAGSAKSYADNSKGYSDAASASAQNASKSEANASTYAGNAGKSASAAATSATNASTYAGNAKSSATEAESWAIGGTGTRSGEDTNNAKYWSKVAENVAGGGVNSFNGRAGAVTPAKGDYTAEMVGADKSGAAATVQGNLDTHTGNTTAHVTADEKSKWNAKSEKTNSFTVTLYASSWSSNSQTVSDSNFITSGYAYIVSPKEDSFAAYSEAIIYASDVSQAGKMIFYCSEVPTVNLTVNVLRVEAEE